MSLRQNALVAAVLIALTAIVGAWSDDPTLAGMWRLPLALLLLGFAYEAWVMSRARVQLSMKASRNGVLGQTSQLRVSLGHSLARATDIELAPDAPAVVEVAETIHELRVPAGSTADIELGVTPRRLGEHVWPAMRARIAGPLGLAWWTRRLAPDFKLRVVPALLQQGEARMGAVGSGLRSRAVLGAGAELLQLRDYRSGDPQHLIDWKATARNGRLVSRDFIEDQHLEIVIAIDVGRTSALRAGELDRLGHYANLAARFAEHAVAQDDRVGLMLFADRPVAAMAPARGSAALLRIRKLLTASKVVAAESNPLDAALRIRSLVRQRSLILLLTDLDDATAAGQLASAARLLLPKHLPLIVGVASNAVDAMGSAPATSWLDPYESLAAQEYSKRLQLNTQALRALGAPALLVKPEQLERAVFRAYSEFRLKRRV